MHSDFTILALTIITPLFPHLTVQNEIQVLFSPFLGVPIDKLLSAFLIFVFQNQFLAALCSLSHYWVAQLHFPEILFDLHFICTCWCFLTFCYK